MKIVLGSYDRVPHPYHHQFLEGGLETWTISDANPRHESIKKVDARDIQFKDVEALYASHILEHIRYDEVLKTLNHWRSVLKDGGWVHINVPDIEWAMDAWMKLNCGEPTGSDYFNSQEKMLDIVNGDASTDWDTHKSWYTKERLHKLLDRAGFSEFKVWKEYEAHDMGCILARATK